MSRCCRLSLCLSPSLPLNLQDFLLSLTSHLPDYLDPVCVTERLTFLFFSFFFHSCEIMETSTRPARRWRDGRRERRGGVALSPSAGSTQNSLTVCSLPCELFGSFLQDVTSLTSGANSLQLEMSECHLEILKQRAKKKKKKKSYFMTSNYIRLRLSAAKTHYSSLFPYKHRLDALI